MTKTLQRAVVSAFAVLVAIAGLDVSGALAQALPTDHVTSTTCGSGTLDECGEEDILKCEWKFEIDFNILSRSFGLRMGESSCTKIGSQKRYKDINTPDRGICTSPIGGGSRGPGSTGSRGSGDDESGDALCSL